MYVEVQEVIGMECRDLLTDGYGRILIEIEPVLEGLKFEDLDWRSWPECTGIGWLIWHITRKEDSAIAYLMHEEQLWITEMWHARYSRLADMCDGGTGHLSEDIAAFQSPDIETITGYHYAVLSRTRKYLSSLTGDDLGRVLNLKYLPPLTTLGSFLIMIMGEELQHVGQADYIRCMHNGIDW